MESSRLKSASVTSDQLKNHEGNAPISEGNAQVTASQADERRPIENIRRSPGPTSNQPPRVNAPPGQDVSGAVIMKMQTLVVQSLKEPPRFNGKTDPEDWLHEFRRAEVFNSRTPEQMLASVPFCFSGEVLDWFDNESDQFDRWETFERVFKARFVDSTKISEEARETRRRLVYEKGASFTHHLETVLQLCRKLDANVSQEENVRKFVQTFDEEQAMTFVGKALRTVSELRVHVYYLDMAIPVVNKKTQQQSSINAVSRQKSPVRAQSGNHGPPVFTLRLSMEEEIDQLP